MARRPRAVRVGIPALFVAILTLVALWQLGAPFPPTGSTSEPASNRPRPLDPLAAIADLLVDTSIGRQAALENIVVDAVPSRRTAWIGDDPRVFVVFDPDVRNTDGVMVQPGSRATFIGLVRAAPPEDVAMRQWTLDAATAKTVRDGGTYLHVTEIRPVN